VRRGAQNLPVTTPEGRKQLEYVKGLSSFETEVLNLGPDVIGNSLPILEFMLAVIQSPGRLPAHITPANILSERFAKNGTIVRLINKFPEPPNKDVGEGLNTASAAMHKARLKEPVITNLENGVLVTIKHETLASPETLILGYLETHGTIKNKEVREICHIQADYVVQVIFRKLMERQLIERVPGTRTAATAYRRGPRFSEGGQGNY
jgi:ATP-dependent DNA helicase RecG